jgi:hypothetical protein
VLSERTPFSDIATVAIPDSGEQLLIGRSSKACHFQLPYNSLISRVHVAVTYEAPLPKPIFGQAAAAREGSTPKHASSSASGRVLIECVGWNGCNVRFKGRVNTLSKGEIFVAAEPVKEIMLDVMDSRVILTWPETESALQSPQANDQNHIPNWVDNSPTRRLGRRLVDAPIASSPPQLHLESPVSPSPAARHGIRGLQSPTGDAVHVYEDPASEANFSSPSKGRALKRQSSSDDDAEPNENEENEPVVHTLGPFGSNILSKFNDFTTSSPRPTKRRKTLDDKAESATNSPSASPSAIQVKSEPIETVYVKLHNESPIKNHVINQLAFSRIHSTPVSTIYGNLPADLKSSKHDGDEQQLTASRLKALIHSIPCVGEISREGKDAAGKPLENEFYYIPDMDENSMRRVTVTSGKGSAGLRAVRKNHKVDAVSTLLEAY